MRGVWALISLTGIHRLIIRLMLDRRVPFLLKLILPAAIVYIILPIDLVPDFVPFGIGRIDDLLILLGAGVLFLLLAPRDVLMELAGHPAHRGGSRNPTDGVTVIEGKYRPADE